MLNRTTIPESPKYTLTVQQFADRMQVSMPTAYGMTERKGFPLIRVGRKKLIPIEALNEWLARQAEGTR